jgi:hypothetical protein
MGNNFLLLKLQLVYVGSCLFSLYHVSKVHKNHPDSPLLRGFYNLNHQAITPFVNTLQMCLVMGLWINDMITRLFRGNPLLGQPKPTAYNDMLSTEDLEIINLVQGIDPVKWIKRETGAGFEYRIESQGYIIGLCFMQLPEPGMFCIELTIDGGPENVVIKIYTTLLSGYLKKIEDIYLESERQRMGKLLAGMSKYKQDFIAFFKNPVQ